MPTESKSAAARVKNPLPVPQECRYCNSKVSLVDNEKIYGMSFGDWPWSYQCDSCDAYVGVHPRTLIPLGTLANRELREARKAAKSAFNPKWLKDSMSRTQAYQWLATELGIPFEQCHIGWFEVAMCQRVCLVCM